MALLPLEDLMRWWRWRVWKIRFYGCDIWKPKDNWRSWQKERPSSCPMILGINEKKHFFFSTFDSWSLQRHGMMALVGRILCSVLLGDQFFLKIFPSEFGKVVWFSDPHIFWKKSPTSWTSVSRCLLRETFNVSGSNMLVSGSTCFWWSIGTLNHNSWIDHS